MKPNTNFLPFILSTVLLIVILCGLSYFTAPATEEFMWSSLNPVELINGISFALSFGLGFHFVLSYFILVAILTGLWFCLFRLIRKISKLF